MKAVLVSHPGNIELVERDIPKIASEDEVLLKVRLAGICGSDMHIYHGTSPVATYPRIIGHEFVGEVVEKGKEVKNLKIGDKVVVEPIIYCGKCYPCRKGRPNVCENLKVMGVHVDGGFQEYVVVKETNVHKFADYLSWEEAVMMEPFTIAAQATWRGGVEKDDFVLIIGAGPIGLTILQYAKYKGAICIVSDIVDFRLEKALELGADYVVKGSENIEKEIRKITGGMGANIAIDAACTPKTFEMAVNVVSQAGRVVVLGFDTSPSSIPQFNITKGELTICGSRLQTNKFKEVIDVFNKRKLNPTALISHKFHFTEIKEAINLLEEGNQNVFKVILEF